jgi:hypothetical protein
MRPRLDDVRRDEVGESDDAVDIAVDVYVVKKEARVRGVNDEGEDERKRRKEDAPPPPIIDDNGLLPRELNTTQFSRAFILNLLLSGSCPTALTTLTSPGSTTGLRVRTIFPSR